MERRKLSKEKNLREKGEPESGMELNSVFKEINRLNRKIKGMVMSEQDPTQLFPSL